MAEEYDDGGLIVAEMRIICRQTHTETQVRRNPGGLDYAQLAEQLEFTARHLRKLHEGREAA